MCKDNQELIQQLKEIDIFVPLRTEGRSKFHTERWIIARLLATLSQYNQFNFPFSLVHRDKPDFLISSGDSLIGIEVTESIPEKYAQFCAIAEREFPDRFLDIGHFRWGSSDLTLEEMRRILAKGQITSPGWEGDSVEREWAQFIRYSIEKKLANLANDGFEKYRLNWLAVYDILPMPHIDLELAVSYLIPLIQDLWQSNPGFDAVFIEHGSVIVQLTSSSTVHMVINDLW